MGIFTIWVPLTVLTIFAGFFLLSVSGLIRNRRSMAKRLGIADIEDTQLDAHPTVRAFVRKTLRRLHWSMRATVVGLFGSLAVGNSGHGTVVMMFPIIIGLVVLVVTESMTRHIFGPRYQKLDNPPT